MLDWRGLIGTSLIHGAAIVGWPALDLSQTYCMCGRWGDYDPVAVQIPEVRRVSVFPTASQPTGPTPPVMTLDAACSGPAERTPIMIASPDIPRSLRSHGPIAFCASVDSRGRVTALRLLRAGEHPRRSIAMVRRLLKDTRFAPAVHDGRAVASRVELALTS